MNTGNDVRSSWVEWKNVQENLRYDWEYIPKKICRWMLVFMRKIYFIQFCDLSKQGLWSVLAHFAAYELMNRQPSFVAAAGIYYHQHLVIFYDSVIKSHYLICCYRVRWCHRVRHWNKDCLNVFYISLSNLL